MTQGSTMAVLSKELREQYLRSGRPAFSFWSQVAFDVIVGVGIPFFVLMFLRATRGPLDTGLFLAMAVLFGVGIVAFIGLFSPMAVILDSIAGERERHTLETLLGTPVSDWAILWGKMLPIYIAALVHVFVTSFALAVTATVLVGPVGLVAGLLVLAIGLPAAALTSTLYTGIGLLISMRAPTVKQGQQWLMYASLPLMVPFMLSGFFMRSLGNASPQLLQWTPFVLGGTLLAVDILLLAWVHVAFRRDRLIAHASP